MKTTLQSILLLVFVPLIVILGLEFNRLHQTNKLLENSLRVARHQRDSVWLKLDSLKKDNSFKWSLVPTMQYYNMEVVEIGWNGKRWVQKKPYYDHLEDLIKRLKADPPTADPQQRQQP